MARFAVLVSLLTVFSKYIIWPDDSRQRSASAVLSSKIYNGNGWQRFAG
jgi:hypothetical protein